MKRFSLILVGLFFIAGSFPAFASKDPEPLERYELKDLRVKAVELTGCKPVAFIRDPDGYVHTVSAGEGIGKHAGRIVSISDKKIVVAELWPDSKGGWNEVFKDIAVPSNY